MIGNIGMGATLLNDKSHCVETLNILFLILEPFFISISSWQMTTFYIFVWDNI